MTSIARRYQEQLLDRTIRFAVHAMRASDPAQVMDRFLNAQVLVTGRPQLLQTAPGQIMASTAANIIARFAGRVAFCVPEDAALVIKTPFAQAATLHDHLLALCRSINPYVDVAERGSPRPTVALSVGTVPLDATSVVAINAYGWEAYVSTLGDELQWEAMHNSPFGALAAAALGTAEVFKRLLSVVKGVEARAVTPLGRIAFSTFDPTRARGPEVNPRLPDVVDLGTVDVVSVGAITSALLWSLYMVPGVQLAGRGIDGQALDVTNLGRYLLAEADEAVAGRNKALALLPKVADRLRLQPIPMDFEVYRDQGALLGKVPAVVGVDNDPGRWAVQATWPPTVLCSGTELDVAQVLAWNRHADGACVGCAYPRRSTVFARSTTPVPTAPFVSAVAGILTAAELIRHTLAVFEDSVPWTVLNLQVLHPHHARAWRLRPERACAVQCPASRAL